MFTDQDTRSEYDAFQERHSEFTRLFRSAQQQLHRRAILLVGNKNDADDVMQEVSLVLWQKFDEFETGTSFIRWSMVITSNVARHFSRKRRRHSASILNEETMAKLVQSQNAFEELLELRRERLTKCLGQLSVSDRQFLASSCDPKRTIVQLADEMARPVHSLYVKLSRLRKLLYHCVNIHLGQE